MASTKQLQKIIKMFRLQSPDTEIDFEKVAEYAVRHGIEPPKPKDPMKLLEMQLTKAAKAELGKDEKTGRPYREYHALPVKQGERTSYVYISIADANRSQMQRSLQKRREQMVDDAVKLTNDAEHWANLNPDAQLIQLELDLQFDVDLRRAAENDDEDDDEPKPA